MCVCCNRGVGEADPVSQNAATTAAANQFVKKKSATTRSIARPAARRSARPRARVKRTKRRKAPPLLRTESDKTYDGTAELPGMDEGRRSQSQGGARVRANTGSTTTTIVIATTAHLASSQSAGKRTVDPPAVRPDYAIKFHLAPSRSPRRTTNHPSWLNQVTEHT
jgi:hypothetical protein